MGCIVKLTAVVALATGLHINMSSEALAYSTLGLPENFSGTELFEKYFTNSSQEGGFPEDAGNGGGGRSFRDPSAGDGEGFPDADSGTGSR